MARKRVGVPAPKGPRQKKKSGTNPRMTCAFTNMLLSTSEPKIVIDDVGVKIVVAEEAFFREFVFPTIMTKRLKADKKKAAQIIPGLSSHKGKCGIRWKLSFRQFAKRAPIQILGRLLAKLPEESALHLRVSSADERARMMGMDI